MTIFYVLRKGDYHRTRNILVCSDVKKVAEKYVEIIQQGGYGDPFYNPTIEVWTERTEDYPFSFHENNANLKQIIKYLSKVAYEEMQKK